MVNNVLAYGPDGKVFLACLNYSESWHDSTIVSELISFLKERIGDFKIYVDQGFPRSGDVFGVLRSVGPLLSVHSVKTLRERCLQFCENCC